MTDATAAPASPRIPWHFWVVALLSIPWNAYGAYDYVMTQTGGDAYLREFGMTDAQIDYFHAMPAWMTGVWAIGVWGAVLGSLLLLLRSKWAFHVLVLSFAAFLLSLVYQFTLTNGIEIMGQAALIMSGVIAIACVFFIWYSWTMSKRGVLR
jgi:hypothetical protein